MRRHYFFLTAFLLRPPASVVAALPPFNAPSLGVTVPLAGASEVVEASSDSSLYSSSPATSSAVFRPTILLYASDSSVRNHVLLSAGATAVELSTGRSVPSDSSYAPHHVISIFSYQYKMYTHNKDIAPLYHHVNHSPWYHITVFI